MQSLNIIKRSLKLIGVVFVGCFVLIGAGLALLSVRQHRTASAVAREWQTTQVLPLTDLGNTQTLTILPLVDELALRDDYQTEHGVSYLIETDSTTILFDVGQNTRAANPSPLEANMARLGISLHDINTLFITHNHPDHTGGQSWWRSGTFSLGNEQPELTGKVVYVPTPLDYPDATPIVATQPKKIAEGVATLGAISYAETWPMSLFGARNVEQALMVNVEDRGIVIISGCGHQTLSRLIERTQDLGDEPIIGIVGGLHYGRSEAKTLEPDLRRLQDMPLQLIALSPHDSETAARVAFQEAFPKQYQDIQVGKPIELTATAALVSDTSY
jgi:7,8-dihydropterin-6-yl-methyl-4-(beta-D-ribofuranosyl)aminobenzene 5'-phosphate synthase